LLCSGLFHPTQAPGLNALDFDQWCGGAYLRLSEQTGACIGARVLALAARTDVFEHTWNFYVVSGVLESHPPKATSSATWRVSHSREFLVGP
jgi:hypothetical protein